ncbi:MAG: hypothetical protein GY852_10680, partial [bacterium]|nr:hypothetical protein [bacterium]
TWDTNLTTENLTVYYDAFDPDMGEIRNTTNWYVNDVSLMALNFPFGVGSNSTWTQDYTDYGNNGTVSGATWNAIGDFDGWGTYEFSGSSQYIFSPNTPSLSITGPITLEVWGKFDSVSGTRAILSKYDAGANQRSYALEIDGANCAAGQVAFYIMPLGTTTGGAARCSNSVLTTGTWHHIVARYVPSGVMEIYIDGVDQTGTMGYGSYVPDSIFASSRGLAIGGSFSSSALPDTAWLDGTLSKVRIYNRTLSPEQIILLYNNVTDTMHHHDTRQDEIWRACVTPNDMIIDGTMNCSNNLTISRIGMENVTVASSSGTNTSDENITVSYDLFNGSAIGITNWYVDDVPTLNLYLPFEGYDGDPGVAKDYSPYSINGTLRDLTWNATMHNGRPGYDFDSTSDYIRFNRADIGGIMAAGDFTIEVWANPDTYPGGRGEMVSTIQSGGYSLGLFPNGSAYFRIDVGSYTDITSAYAVSTGEWHHIVATFDESTGNAKIYVDGTLNGSSTLVGTYDAVGGAFCIGEQSGGSTVCNDGENFDGQISLVRYWNRTLTSGQVASLYGDYDGDTISSDETEIGEVWKSCVLPNGDWEDSLNPEVCRNITIESPPPPIVENVTLNSTLGTNYTNEDLTVWYDSFSPEGYEVKNMTTWFLTNGSVTNKSIMTLLLPFEGGTEAERGRDYTSYEHNVTTVNSMAYYPNGGYDGWGVYGCQASTSVYMELNNSAMDGMQDFTIMMWVNKSSTAGSREAIISGAGASSTNEFALYPTSTNMRVYLRGSYDTFTGFDLGQNEWHHIAFKRTANQGEFFVDGVSMGTATVSTATLDIGGCAPTQPAPSGFVLCQEQDACGGSFSASQAWEGMVDDIRIFNMSLTVDQIAAISNNLTDVIVSNETSVDDTWQACVRANDGVQASVQNCSNNLTILEPPEECPVISTPGEYILDQDYTGAPNSLSVMPSATSACMKITTSDVILDCNGSKITGDDTAGSVGVALNGSLTNVTVKNCIISNYTVNIYSYNSNDSFYLNNTLSYAGVAAIGFNVFLYGSSNNLVSGNYMANATGKNRAGIRIAFEGAGNNTIVYNEIYNCYMGIRTTTSTQNNISGNRIHDSPTHAILLEDNSNWNSISNNSIYDNPGGSGVYLYTCHNNTLLNNSLSGNNIGVDIQDSNENNFTNNTLNLGDEGFHLRDGSSDNRFINCSTEGSSQYGVQIEASHNNTFENLVSSGGTDYGLYLVNAQDNSFQETVLYDNGNDTYIECNFGTTSYYMMNTSILKPAGTWEDYTVLTINDTLSAGERYVIKWTTNSSSLPSSGRVSFRNKFVNISQVLGSSSIDEITWNWNASEESGYDPSKFELWKYNATNNWTMLNDSPDTGARALSLYGMNPASDYGILQKNVTEITVQLNTPSNGHLTTLTTIIFNCSAASPQQMVNITLYGNWSGGWHENETKPLTGTYNSTTFTKTLPLGTYEWNCLAFDTLPDSDWGDSNFTFTLTNASGDVYVLTGANVTVLNSSKYNGSDLGGTYELQGGNLTGADFNMRVSTEKWAGMYGNLTARLLLSESNDTVFMYAWNWTPTSGGEICLTQNAGPFWTAMAPTQKSYIDTAFGFNPTDSDSANNSLTDASVLINVANVSSATTGVHISANSTFEMGAFQFVSNATGEADFAFCVNLTDGKNYRNQSKHFELVVPTTEVKGSGPLETYYVYVELN